MRRLPVPWWRVATFVLLMVALAIAVSKGTTLGAVIVELLAIPSAIFLTVWLYAYLRRGSDRPRT
jgi:hypothetical protein